MRTTRDRMRHAISFEIIGLAIVIPLGAWVFDKPAHHMSMVGAASAIIATLWNYVYNILFDKAMQRACGSTRKNASGRVVHAILFEAGLLVVLLPLIAWYLDVGLWEALLMDVSFAFFYMVYALAFNWGYDRLFPLPEWAHRDVTVSAMES